MLGLPKGALLLFVNLIPIRPAYPTPTLWPNGLSDLESIPPLDLELTNFYLYGSLSYLLKLNWKWMKNSKILCK